MDRLCQDLELMPLHPCLLQQVGGCGLAREEQDLAMRNLAACDDCRFDSGHPGHDHGR